MGKLGVACLVGLVVISVLSLAAGQRESSKETSALTKELSGLSRPPGNAVVGIAVMDIESGKMIFEKNGDSLLNPASNAKIVTAACALKILGPEFRYETSLHGKRDATVIRGPVYLKGHADPTLSTRDLWDMVRTLRSAGVRRIEGGIVVDDTYFDGENLPFAYDQQSQEDAAFRAPVGAVSLNHNTISITISPGGHTMTKARVSVNPKEFGDLNNDSITVAEGASTPKISILPMESRPRIRVWGQVPLGAKPVTYLRRVDDPSRLAGYGLKGVLEANGIAVGGGVRIAEVPPATPRLASHRSLPLSTILYEAGKVSNNFVTEMVLKTIGAEAGKAHGTWAVAIEEVSKVLSKWGLAEGSYQYRNGSGLFDANRFTATQLVKVLRATAKDSTIAPEFVSQLATGGVDGTIASRYQGAGIRRYVRAKTGTLADVSSLSGYVFAETGGGVAFAIMVNKAPGFVSAARAFQEKLVSAMARHLND